MKKGIIALGLISLLALSSCSSNASNVSVSETDKYEHITLDKGEEELQAAISLVEDANVYVSFSDGILNRYAQSAVIYKHSSTTYYALTYYDSEHVKSTGIIVAGDNEFNATLRSYDAYNNIALLTFSTTKSLTTVNIVSETPESSERVFSMSTQAGKYNTSKYSEDNQNIVNTGIISNTSNRLCMHTAMFSEDDFGSGLYDYSGNLIGINVDKVESSSDSKVWGFNYALYGDALKSVVSDLESSTGSIQRISLNGMTYYTNYLNEESAINGYCVLVEVVSPANSFSRMRSGDLIFSVDGNTVLSINTIRDACYLKKSSSTVVLGIYRNNTIYYIDNNGNITN